MGDPRTPREPNPALDPTTRSSSEVDVGALLRGISRGEEASWCALVKCYAPRLFAMAKSRSLDGNVAEELTQSVLVTLATKLRSGEYTEEGKFEAWLFRIAMNRLRDHIRRQQRQTRLLGPTGPGEMAEEVQSDNSRTNTPDGEEIGKLRAAMEMLTPQDRDILDLRHQGGMSFQQISEVLDEPIGTLLARHHRALRKLREIMEAGETLNFERKAGVPHGQG